MPSEPRSEPDDLEPEGAGELPRDALPPRVPAPEGAGEPPSSGSPRESLQSVTRAVQTLAALHQATMQQHETRFSQLEQIVRGLAERLQAALEEWAATQEMHEDHLASWESGLDRQEDVTAALIRLTEEHASRQAPHDE